LVAGLNISTLGEPLVGSKSTGYTHELSPWNPVVVSTLDPTYNYPKRFASVAFTTNQTDFQAPQVMAKSNAVYCAFDSNLL